MSAPEVSVVELFVGPDARVVNVWDQYTYRLSMVEVGVAWTFTFPFSEHAGSAWDDLLDPVTGIKCGHRITLAVDGDAVFSGIAETVKAGDDDPSKSPPVLVISGRDALGPAVSWDALPTLTLRGRAFGDAVQAVYQGVGIVADIGASVDPGATVGRLRGSRARRGRMHARTARNEAVRASHPRIGERAHQVVERMARALGYRVWTTPVEGSGMTGVIVDRPRTGAAQVSLVRERVNGKITNASNVWAGARTTSIANVPSVITVFSDQQRGDNESDQIAREVTNGHLFTEDAAAEVDFEAVQQPRYVQSRNASTEAGAQNEAARLLAEANEKFRTYDCTVLGHRIGGRLLVPNLLADVRDDIAKVTGRWLIVSVEGSGSREGAQRTKLSLLPDGALSLIPEPEPT